MFIQANDEEEMEEVIINRKRIVKYVPMIKKNARIIFDTNNKKDIFTRIIYSNKFIQAEYQNDIYPEGG
jgi:hypothetical protein